MKINLHISGVKTKNNKMDHQQLTYTFMAANFKSTFEDVNTAWAFLRNCCGNLRFRTPEELDRYAQYCYNYQSGASEMGNTRMQFELK